MSPVLLLALFFVMVMGAITVSGYILLSRRAATTPLAPAVSRSMLESTLLRMGEALPSKRALAKKYQKKLILAGYRQAHAPEVFLGLKIALTAILAILCGGAKIIADGDIT